METTPSMTEYLYEKANKQWYELPIDYSSDDFRKFINNSGKLQKNLDHRQIQKAILHIHHKKTDTYIEDEYNPENKNPIYCNIFLQHIIDKTYSKEDRHPSHFFWETQDLLFALTIAFSKNTRLNNEKLAEYTLKELGSLLGEKTIEEVRTNLITQKLLIEPNVQRTMAMSFEQDLEDRMRAIWELTHQLPSDVLGSSMMDTLRKLDNILLELMDLRDGTQKVANSLPSYVKVGASQPTYTAYELFEKLYWDAMAPRNSMRQENTAETDIKTGKKDKEEALLFSLPANEENNAIIRGIQENLQEFKRWSKDTLQDSFEEWYKRYLLAKEGDPSITQGALTFLMDYQKLDRYAHQPSLRIEFTEQFRQELYSFARDIFDSVNKSYMDFRYVMERIFTSACDSFAYGRLESIHQMIWGEINIPIWLIRIKEIFRAIFLIEKPRNDNLLLEFRRVTRMELLNIFSYYHIAQLLYAVRESRRILHENHPDVPLLFSDSPDIVERFVEEYNKVCSVIYHQRKITSDEIKSYLLDIPRDQPLQGNNLFVLNSEATIMEMECKVLVAALIDKAVESIQKEHNKLDSLFT